MTKKDFLIQLLQKLEPERSLVNWFLIMLKDGSATDQDIENIFNIIKTQIDTLHDEELQQETKKVLEYLEIIHQQENQQKIKEQKDIDILLTKIDTL